MHICNIKGVDPKKGDFLLLSDLGSEGITVVSQRIRSSLDNHSEYQAWPVMGSPGSTGRRRITMGEIIEKLRESFSKCQDGAPPEHRTAHRFYINETEKEIERLTTENTGMTRRLDDCLEVMTDRAIKISELTAENKILLAAIRCIHADPVNRRAVIHACEEALDAISQGKDDG